jgi:hypothetical protein
MLPLNVHWAEILCLRKLLYLWDITSLLCSLEKKQLLLDDETSKQGGRIFILEKYRQFFALRIR